MYVHGSYIIAMTLHELLNTKPMVKGVHRRHIQKAQAKLLLMMCYYTLIGMIAITGYTFLITTNRKSSESFQTYFILCQSAGVQVDLDCGQPPEVKVHALTPVSMILIALVPSITLMFTANCTCLKKHRRSPHQIPAKTPL